MQHCIKLLSATALSLTANLAQAQVIMNSDLIGNGNNYRGPEGFAPHLFVEPKIFEVGQNASIQFNGDFAVGGTYFYQDGVYEQGAFIDGTVSSTLRQTSPQGWTYGGTVQATGGVVYLHDAPDPVTTNFSAQNIDAYAFIDTNTLDVQAGRYVTSGIKVPSAAGYETMNGVMGPSVAAFSTEVRGDFAGAVSTKQGPWEATLAADRHNRQHGSVVWRRPVRTVTPAYGVEVIRDGNYDFATIPLTGSGIPVEGQLYGGRAGAMMEYGRLTFGASAGLEAFYDGSSRHETQSIYDVGVSNKTGRVIYGLNGQHRRSHDANVSSSSITTDVTVALATGVDLELGYRYTRLEDEALTEPTQTHEGKADIRLTF